MNICYVIGAGNLPLLYINKNKALVIAADGGLCHLNQTEPDIIVGDFDSLGFVPKSKNTVVLPVEKDVTDMKYAVELGESKGANTFVLYGGTGGRPDHTFANIALLCDLSQRGKRGYLIGEGYVTTAITNNSLCLPIKNSGTISVFAAGDIAKGVDIKGLKYPLNDYTLTFSAPLGVSNSFLGKPSEISVKEGTLIIMWEENNLKEFIDNLGQ